MKTFRILFLIAILSAAALTAAEKTDRSGKKDTKLASLRLLAAGMPGKTLQNWMTTGAWKRWNTLYDGLIDEKGKSPILADFFGTALILDGPQTETTGISALYNPYQDTVLLIQTDLSDRIPRIEDFAFLSGSLFRGEKMQKDQLPEALAPVKSKMDEVLIRNINEIRSVFAREFPKDMKDPSLSKYRTMDPQQTVRSVIDNAAFRMVRLLSLFRKDAKQDLLKTGELCAVLWEGKLPSILKKFDFPGNDPSSAELFSKMTPQVRSSLMPCLYFRNRNGMLLGLASGSYPEFVILISIRENRKPLFLFLTFQEKFLKDIIK